VLPLPVSDTAPAGARPELKRKLLETLRAARDHEAQLEAAAVDVPAHPNGRWSAKDQLAHLAWWRNRAATVVDAARTGGEQPAPVELEVRNTQTYLENKDRSAADIRAIASVMPRS